MASPPKSSENPPVEPTVELAISELPQTYIGPYKLLRKLGAGGMGEVWMAEDARLDRKIALKILPQQFTQYPDRVRRFMLEAKAASALNHPNIITIHEIGQADDAHYIATEYIQGQTLRQHMAGRLMIEEVLDLAAQIASALSAAHWAGIIHRDIKPENVMVRPDGLVKVVDFGIAKLTERASAQQSNVVDSAAVDGDIDNPETLLLDDFYSAKTDHPVDAYATTPEEVFDETAPGIILGTVKYMSPEQLRGQKVDARADIFSLGVVLYEVVTGKPPFAGSTQADVIAAILEREPAPLGDYRSDVPPELEQIVIKALRKDRDARYQDIKDMLVSLKDLKQELEFQAKMGRSAATEVDVKAKTTTIAETILTQIEQHKRGALVILAMFISVTIAVTYFGYTLYTGSGKAGITSLVVLPFTNTGNLPNAEYLSDGISEALINSLTELQQLKVIARSTAFRYKGKDPDPQELGRDLNVRAVLMGQVRQMGDALNIQVDLVDATTGAQLWGEEYDRKVSDVLSIKQAIARLVTEKLRVRLTGEDEQHLVRRDTTNTEAYQYYLRGRYSWNKRTADGIRKAIEQFQQSIDRDPNFALAYVGLADCYVLMEEYTGAPSSESLPKARAAVDRALQIDDSLAEAHTTSAFIYEIQWRWTEAESEYKLAISLNPNYPTAHHWLSVYYQMKRQFDDQLREIKLAQELDPLSPIIGENVSEAYFLKNDFNSAIEQSKKVLELDPSFPYSYRNLGYAHLKLRRYEAATAEFQKAVELSGRASDYLSALGYCYAVTGKRDEALAILKELEERYARRESAGLYLASVYAGLDDKDQAFAWLEKDFEQRSGVLAFITWWFPLEDLRSDSRYADLVRRMGLSQ